MKRILSHSLVKRTHSAKLLRLWTKNERRVFKGHLINRSGKKISQRLRSRGREEMLNLCTTSTENETETTHLYQKGYFQCNIKKVKLNSRQKL